MNILPAIDVLGGKSIRLLQGDFQKKNIYDDDISLTIQRFKTDGARYLHIIDLQAADNPALSQKTEICNKLISAGLHFQIGGGIRNKQQIKKLLDNGADRVIVGSPCVQQPESVKRWLKFFGTEHLVLALDCRRQNNEFLLAAHGWKHTSSTRLFDALSYFAANNLRILATNIEKDGTMTSPDFELYTLIKQKFPQTIIQASGGVSSYQDLETLRLIGVDEVIIGKALYENKINLQRILNNDRY